MGIELGKGKFFVDGVEVGETVPVPLESGLPEYTEIKLPNLKDISSKGTFMLVRWG